MSKNNNVAVEESAAIKRIKQKNMLKKQRLAIVFMVIAIVALVAALIVVDYLVDIYTFEDVDGTAYYVKKNGEVYALYDKDGVACEKNQDGYFETALGTMVSVNAETGECKIYAFVHTSDTEVRDFGEYVLMYKQMTYDHGSTKDNSKIIKSIEVHNEHGTYTFERDSKMNFVIKDMPGAPYNRESFAQLAVACGYTLSTRRLENPKKLENGSVDYAEYGLVSEVRTKTEIDKEGNETNFVINTDKKTVGDALSELNMIDGDMGAYGLYVKTVNDITVDFDKDGKYWAFYVDGEYATKGVENTDITPGATYSFRVE